MGLGSFSGSLSLEAPSLQLELSIKPEPLAFQISNDNTLYIRRHATEFRVCSTGILMASACMLGLRSSWEDVCLSRDWKVGKSYFRSCAFALTFSS